MVTLDEISQDVKISYPCEWEYKIFLPKESCAQNFVKELGLNPKSIQKSKENDKYTCFNTVFIVQSEHERLELFSLLKKHAKFVL